MRISDWSSDVCSSDLGLRRSSPASHALSSARTAGSPPSRSMRATHAAARSLIACAVSRSLILFHSCHSLFGVLLTLGDRLQNQFQTLGHVILDDMLSHPQPLRDLPLRQPFDLAKLEYPAASIRQSLDQSAHPVQFAAAPSDPFGRRLISNDVQAPYFRARKRVV